MHIAGGEHILDTTFSLEKNIVSDTLQFGFRIDSTKLPSDLLRAYFAQEVAALAAKNPSGKAGARQKREARETARQRIEAEAHDGRFLKRKAYNVLWDALSNELLVASTSASVIDRLHTLFEKTFGFGFEPLGAGTLAHRLATTRGQARGIDDAEPSAFVPGVSPSSIHWIMEESSKDWLGNEFLLWLWHTLESSDSIPLLDKSEATLMVANSLSLECPRGQTGKESISHEGPTRLPEARRAIQSGKMPRKAGLIVVRHGSQYEFSLGAETMAVSGAKFPAPEETEERARLDERVAQLRHFLETVDLLYDAFGSRRASDAWPKELGTMQKWLQREERRAATGSVCQFSRRRSRRARSRPAGRSRGR
ncbi:MAG: hypothetical protein K2W96_25105 [Gemmataceae bacterium]|nr:hypothetical protein [Gemmataceae bacterium]